MKALALMVCGAGLSDIVRSASGRASSRVAASRLSFRSVAKRPRPRAPARRHRRGPTGTPARRRRGGRQSLAAQLLPACGHDAAERLDHARVELPAGPLYEFGEGGLVSAPLAVDAVGGD